MSATPDPPGDRDPLVVAAEAAVMRSLVDPGHALQAGRFVLSAARRARSAEAEAVALRAIALAARELGDLRGAEHHLRAAIATDGAPPDRIAQARLSLVTVRTERGHPLQALRVAALAWTDLSPLDRAKLDTQRAVALARLGRHQEAIAACDRALRVLVTAPGTIDDRRFLAGGLLNRGLVHSFRGDWDAAMRDLTACLEISNHAGLLHLARLSAANLPFLAVRRGDIAGAFKQYREAEDTLFGFPERLATMRADFAGALLAAHLPGEARAMLSLAVPDLEASGAHVALAEARLKLAQVELLTGDPHRARQVAEQAAAELAAQDRTSWLPLAREVVLRARLALEPVTPALVAELVTCADELEDGFAHLAGAAALRLVAAEAALALDDHPTASAQLARLTEHAEREEPWAPIGTQLTSLAAEPARTAEIPVPVRQHALALEASLQEDATGAFRAVRNGLSEVSEQVETFDDPALRAHAARAGERLAAFGLGLAVRGGCAGEVFEFAERWRAVAAPSHACSLVDTDRVRAELGAGALVEFVADEEALLAVVIAEGRATLRRVGDVRAVKEAIVRLRYALRRRAGESPTPPPPSPDGHLSDMAMGSPRDVADVEAAGLEVERLLLRPILAELGDGGPLVVVPVGALHTLPWGALPCLRERPVTVAASAAAWVRARELRHARRPGPPVVVAAAGPSLAHAHGEVANVLACHPDAREVPARGPAVLEALGVADVLHLAAHGVFHARSPLVSGITLDDGPLMAYDLLDVPRSPELVVLSACNSGMSRTPVDGAPLGLPGTFLAKGSSCVVAGLVPVRDEGARALMSVFHELVAAGHSPAAALASAAAKTGELGFACFGAGDQPLY
ncbi:CHAT domain-containing protein [Nonomuraea phyllanthi]|uniref:CHAT domain-containing protein n=1 Tax=Nonomuraea phyllanthi TaxID=2219224 RepID=A0A5C4V4X3_9ACTN|nr:CHAT domain-containing tetratricopeptide repeat protein [Nonomuraea phyllanthi]KAB8186297.1 CHAT domain-containing protein [Nonomuraea phyllanthi]